MPSAIPCYQLDTNVLLRFLRNDHKDHGARAAKLVRQANDGKAVLEVSAVIVAEVIYAMKAAYKMDRRRISQVLLQMLSTPAFRLCEAGRIKGALARMASANVDFADAYLAAAAYETNTAVASFDRDLDKFADIRRHEP